MGGNVSENGEANVLLATVEGGEVWCAGREGRVEDGAPGEEAVHPVAPGSGGHDGADDGDAIGDGKLRGFFSAAD